MIQEKVNNNNITIPALAMRDLVIFPKMVIHFDVARIKSVNSIKTALNTDRKIFLA